MSQNGQTHFKNLAAFWTLCIKGLKGMNSSDPSFENKNKILSTNLRLILNQVKRLNSTE